MIHLNLTCFLQLFQRKSTRQRNRTSESMCAACATGNSSSATIVTRLPASWSTSWCACVDSRWGTGWNWKPTSIGKSPSPCSPATGWCNPEMTIAVPWPTSASFVLVASSDWASWRMSIRVALLFPCFLNSSLSPVLLSMISSWKSSFISVLSRTDCCNLVREMNRPWRNQKMRILCNGARFFFFPFFFFFFFALCSFFLSVKVTNRNSACRQNCELAKPDFSQYWDYRSWTVPSKSMSHSPFHRPSRKKLSERHLGCRESEPKVQGSTFKQMKKSSWCMYWTCAF